MAKPRIVILGAGLGGAIAAFEIKDAVRDKAEVSVVSRGDTFHFVPSNPWVAVHWRKREAIEVKLPPVFKKLGIAFSGAGAKKVVPTENRIELNDGSALDYDYLVIATGPDLAFDEIAGLGPHGGFTQSI
jgi:sulfide:quinone oxidoreductase